MAVGLLLACAYFVGAAYLFCRGDARRLASESSETYVKAKQFVSKIYRYAPTLTFVALIVTIANVYSLHFRYHAYDRENGYYLYDRLFRHGQYVGRIDCPEENPDR